MSEDLSEESLATALPGRELHVYPTVVSTEADAMAWARAGAPEGSLVVSERQISARSRPRRRWPTGGDSEVSFTLIAYPHMPPVRGGLLHLAATMGIADAHGPDAQIEWPDEVYLGDRLVGLVSVHLEQTVRGLEWALINVMLPDADRPRADTLAAVVAAVETRIKQPSAGLIAEWTARCRTIGRSVAALLYPIGRERRAAGRAVGVRPTGALIVEDDNGHQEGIRPHDLAAWEN